MKKFLAFSIVLAALGAGAPSLAQNQTQICDRDGYLACMDVCDTKNLSPNATAGCYVGCGIATGCDA